MKLNVSTLATSVAIILASSVSVSADAEARLHGLLQRERLLERQPMRPAILPDELVRMNKREPALRRAVEGKMASRRAAAVAAAAAINGASRPIPESSMGNLAALHNIFAPHGAQYDDADEAADDLAIRQLNMPLPIRIRAASADDTDDDLEDDFDCEEWEDESTATAAPITPTSSSASTTWSPPVTSSTSFSSASPTPSSAYVAPSPAALAASTPSSSSSIAKAPRPTVDLTPASSSASAVSAPSINSDVSASASSSAAPLSVSTNDEVYYLRPSSTNGAVQSAHALFNWGETAAVLVPTNATATITTTHTATSTVTTSAGSAAITWPSAAALAGPSPISILSTPTNIAQGSLTVAEGCTRYYTVKEGDICLGILENASDVKTSLQELYSYNPAIDSVCSNLQIGWALCIASKPVVLSVSKTWPTRLSHGTTTWPSGSATGHHHGVSLSTSTAPHTNAGPIFSHFHSLAAAINTAAVTRESAAVPTFGRTTA